MGNFCGKESSDTESFSGYSLHISDDEYEYDQNQHNIRMRASSSSSLFRASQISSRHPSFPTSFATSTETFGLGSTTLDSQLGFSTVKEQNKLKNHTNEEQLPLILTQYEQSNEDSNADDDLVSGRFANKRSSFILM